jgi:hydrogenase/urease accessory protein HupE
MAATILTIDSVHVLNLEPAASHHRFLNPQFMFARSLIAIVLVLCGTFSSQAHDPGLSSAKLVLQSDGTLRAILTFAPGDMAAICNGDRPDLARLETLAGQSLEIWFDGRPSIPTAVKASILANKDVEFDLRFRASQASQIRVRSVLLDRLPFGHRQYFALNAGGGATLAEKLLSSSNQEVDVALAIESLRSVVPPHPFSEFLEMGIKHILTGYDHLLFLFALFIGCNRFSSVVKVITAFTIAHSISLALATLGWVEIPSRVVEPLIAATIVYVGIENILRGRAVSHRALLTFGFGLVHGFGFAGALREMGVGTNGGAVAVSLLAFNCGVEIGQMAVAALILPILWRLKDRPQFTLRYAPACSVLVALAGGFWFIQRVCGN